MDLRDPEHAEWLDADGLGGFMSGTVADVRTRRYHAVLLHATTPPSGRRLLVNGFEAWIEAGDAHWPLTSQRYAPGVVHPDPGARRTQFERDPWPRWTTTLPGGIDVVHGRFVRHGEGTVVAQWNVRGAPEGAALCVRLLLSGRDPHALHHENPAFRFDPETASGALLWRPYDGVPGVLVKTDGTYTHAPGWWRNFEYVEERARGLDSVEDLASPGVFRWELSRGDAVLLLAADSPAMRERFAATDAREQAREYRAAERRRRRRLPTALDRAADQYLVARGKGRTIVAGYPWFGDWGRDTFIAMRGLCLATGRLDDARRILLEWAGAVSEGMLPNRFPDEGETPEYNSVDASLWFAVVTGEWLDAMAAAGRAVSTADRSRLGAAVEAILDGYSRGTRYGIRADADGLLAAGAPGVQLTWMDARIGDWVVTPRIGKPVEVQALWVGALDVGSRFDPRWAGARDRAKTSFAERFWNASRDALFDVVDVDHVPGTADGTLRPNQLFAIGGLPFTLLDDGRSRTALATIERELWTPLGPRSLAPGEPGYRRRYAGGVLERDSAYHQGTVWPWLAGAFVDAWLHAHGDEEASRREARERFLAPLLAHLEQAGLGHVSEVADAEAPQRPGGCPFQAWSVGEALRLRRRLAPRESAGSVPNDRRPAVLAHPARA